jgi:ectoine hydroxylase-related dioxygenase (phytanoyl-CoA dioxygenase family)
VTQALTTREILANYIDDGFVVVPQLLDTAFLQMAARHFEHLCSDYGLPSSAAIVAAPCDDRSAAELAATRSLVGLVVSVLAGPVSVFGFTYLHKAPYVSLPASWHQDAPAWTDQLGGSNAVTAWIALTAADESNGCMRAIPGSHQLPTQVLHREEGGSTSMFGVSMDQSVIDERAAVGLVMEPGDVVLLHPNLAHSSLPNHSANRRLALAIRFRSP